MICQEFTDLLASYAENMLVDPVLGDVETHLARCEVCRSTLNATRDLIDRLEKDGRVRTAPSIITPVMDRIIQQQALQLRRNIPMWTLARLSVAAALVGVVIVWTTLSPSHRNAMANASDLTAARKGMEGANSATWKVSYYVQLRSKDGREKKWFKEVNNGQRYFYKSPGRYRMEELGADGKVTFVSIEDQVNRAKLEMNVREKTATLTPLGPFPSSYHPDGPFAKYLELMKRDDIQSLGKKEVGGGIANGFRCAFFQAAINRDYSFDFWINAETKRLVLCQDPGGDILDLANIVRDQGVTFPAGDVEYAGKTFEQIRDKGGQPGNSGHTLGEIAFNVKLDDPLFSLEPPDGFTVKVVEAPAISEKDVTEFMAITADYFGKTFPDQFPYFNHQKEEYDRFERIEQEVMKQGKGTPAEARLVKEMHKWWRTGIPGPGPMHAFTTQMIEKGSWKYLGKGVKLGDKDRIVCWFRPNGSRTFRVIYGDLTVKDVAPGDLPLPVQR
jgi:outer membrane lipoprotein-sorting protein